MTHRRRWTLVALAAAGTVIAVLVAAATRIPFSSETLRKRVVASLAEALDAEVELDDLTLHFSPRLYAIGTGLVIRHHRRHDVPPLISVQRFTVSARLLGLWHRRVDLVTLVGLDIQIPPRDDGSASAAPGNATAGDDQPRDGRPSAEAVVDTEYARSIVIDDLEAPDAKLSILRRDPQKPTRVWSLHSLHAKAVGLNSEMPFAALLTNALPPGEINTTGTFGPWQREEPSSTPLAGRFGFDHADLGVFGGIAGILSATGTFGGTLDQIAVDGQTDTPDFMVSISGHPIRLVTTYHAVVDGTNGNTTLDPVNATFLDTSVVARGGVYEEQPGGGRVIRLQVDIEKGRLDDVMRLAVNAPKPSMTGSLFLTAKFVIPPGKDDVVNKLQLEGRFAIGRGTFTDPVVQQKINELSRRASGNLGSTAQATRVTSDFTGRFGLRRSRLALPIVTFDIPGAVVELAGAYTLRQEQLAFSGNLFMDAKISQTTTGYKAWLLKIADPLFRHGGRTVIPLTIDGQRTNPHFGVDVKRVFRRGSHDSRSGRGKVDPR